MEPSPIWSTSTCSSPDSVLPFTSLMLRGASPILYLPVVPFSMRCSMAALGYRRGRSCKIPLVISELTFR